MTTQMRSRRSIDKLLKVAGPSETIKVISLAVREFHRDFSSNLPEFKEFLKEALSAVGQGDGDLASAVYATVITIISNIRTDRPVRRIIDEVSRTVIDAAALAKVDVEEASRGLIEGIVDCAKQLKLNTSEAVSEAATAAVRAAYEINEGTGRQVQEALSGTLSGIKVILKNEPQRTEVLYATSAVK